MNDVQILLQTFHYLIKDACGNPAIVACASTPDEVMSSFAVQVSTHRLPFLYHL